MNKEIETIQETITRFINKGVYQTKIIPTESPSVFRFSFNIYTKIINEDEK